MKKYVKPELFYESFELSQQIAVCDYDHKGNQTDVTSCSFTGPNPVTGVETAFFLDGVTNCAEAVEGYCITNSANVNFNLFNS